MIGETAKAHILVWKVIISQSGTRSNIRILGWLCLKKALFVGKLALAMDAGYADRGTLLGIWLSLRSGDGVESVLSLLS